LKLHQQEHEAWITKYTEIHEKRERGFVIFASFRGFRAPAFFRGFRVPVFFAFQHLAG